MYRFLMSAAVIGLSLALSATAQARDNRPVAASGCRDYHYYSHTTVCRDYHLTHGTKYSWGYCYPGRNHCQWSYRCWNDTYNCTTYWCPSTRCHYYWCERDCCYYPVHHRPYGSCR